MIKPCALDTCARYYDVDKEDASIVSLITIFSYCPWCEYFYGFDFYRKRKEVHYDSK